MRVRHSDNDRVSFARRLDRQQEPKLYTPSMDGFERFVRESVGLDAAVPGDGQDGDERPLEGRKMG
jgi:hypothetical protein